MGMLRLNANNSACCCLNKLEIVEDGPWTLQNNEGFASRYCHFIGTQCRISPWWKRNEVPNTLHPAIVRITVCRLSKSRVKIQKRIISLTSLTTIKSNKLQLIFCKWHRISFLSLHINHASVWVQTFSYDFIGHWKKKIKNIDLSWFSEWINKYRQRTVLL